MALGDASEVCLLMQVDRDALIAVLNRVKPALGNQHSCRPKFDEPRYRAGVRDHDSNILPNGASGRSGRRRRHRQNRDRARISIQLDQRTVRNDPRRVGHGNRAGNSEVA